jgi:F0F1-type ATP synthase delta subunit
MEKDIMYTLHIYNKNIDDIEKHIKKNFNIKFLAHDQYELKVYFTKELSDNEENKLFYILEKFNKN